MSPLADLNFNAFLGTLTVSRLSAVEVHHVRAALFIEDVCADLRSDHIILSHLTSSPTSIKQYAQLRLVLENEYQTCIEFY